MTVPGTLQSASAAIFVSKPAPQVAAVYQPLTGGTKRAHDAL
jgi:hypothetical protein